MFALPRIFHVSHVVDDLDAAVAWYDDVFAPQVWQRTELLGSGLALLVIGDVVMMPMQPAPESGFARFRARSGERLHSLAVYVDEPVPLIDKLRADGYYLRGFMGNELDNPQDEIWTKPGQSPMVMEFFQPRESMGDPRLEEPDWSPAPWRDDHPMRVQGSVHTCITPDAEQATTFFTSTLGGRVVHQGDTPYGTRSTFVRLSDQVTIEVAQPTDPDGAPAQDLAAGGTFHAVTLTVGDLDGAVAHAIAKGIGVERLAAGHATLDPSDTLGVRFRLTDRAVGSW